MNQRKAGILLNYINEAIKILTVLLYTPVMLRLLGQAEYGLYQMVSSVVSYLGLLSFGFGSAYVRFDSRYMVNGDRDGEARLNGMFLLIFAGLAGICLICGGILTSQAEMVFGSGLSPEELVRAKRILGILVGNLALTLLNTVFDCHIGARERFRFQNGLRIVQSLLSPFLTLPLLLLGWGSPAIAVVSTVLTVLTLGMNLFYCKKKLKMAFSFQNLQPSLLKELWIFTFFLFLNQITDQINWSVDRFLLGRMCGTPAAAVYSIGGQINGMYLQLSTAICMVFVPKVHRMAQEPKSESALTQLMIRVGRMQLTILLLVLSGFCFFGRPFLRLWAGDGYEEAYIVALLLMVPMTIPLVQNLSIEIQRARNKHRARSLVYGCLALGNLFLSIFLIPRWGCSGAALGTALTQLAGTGLFMNWYYHRKLGLNIPLFWKEMGKSAANRLPAILLGGILASFAEIQSWGSLLVFGFLYVLVYGASVWREIKKGQANACPRK